MASDAARVQLAAEQLFYWPIIIMVFRQVPDWTPFTMGVLFGAHFLPYAWLYRSRAYAVLAIATSSVLTVAVLVTRSPLYAIAPLLAAACYGVAVAMLWREATQGRTDRGHREQPEEEAQPERVDWPARRAAIAALALMLAYFAIDNHVPLYPWNNLASAGPQLPSTLAGWIPGLFTMWALARGSRWGITFGAGWTVVWSLLQVRQWWLPYLFGPTPLHQEFGWYWERGYAQTLHILPARALRPVPDVEHIVLQLLSLAAAFYTVRAATHAWMRATNAGIARRRGGSLGD